MSLLDLQTKLLNTIEMACIDVYGQKPSVLALQYPPNVSYGDFSYGCFALSEQFNDHPAKIARHIASHIHHGNWLEQVESVGPYINFKIDSDIFFNSVCTEIMMQGDKYGNAELGQGKHVMVEYLSPNTNKPLHLGHIRNGVLGMAIANLLKAAGYEVVKANLVNDRGVHICKSMLAWEKWADGTTPMSVGQKGDHFVGKWYVRYAKEEAKDPCIQEEVQTMLRRWEEGDPKTLDLWRTMNNWVYKGFAQTYEVLGLKFDVFYYESSTYMLGKDLVDQGVKHGIFSVSSTNAVVANLPVEIFGAAQNGMAKMVTLLRPDGTSVYMTQDLGTAKMKYDEYQLDRSIYVVGSEQNYHFRCLFSLLKQLGFEWADQCYHLSYGMVLLPEGKMKSREGTVVDADDLVEATQKLAQEEIISRNHWADVSHEEIQERALSIALGAIKFYLLRVRPEQDIYFDPKESISFEGFTGPYCQYAYARSFSILRNTEDQDLTYVALDYSMLGNQEERQLAQVLIQFPEEVRESVNSLNPARLCSHVFLIAQAFNQYYHKYSVLSAETIELTRARLELVKATSIVLKRGLALLGIDATEKV